MSFFKLRFSSLLLGIKSWVLVATNTKSYLWKNTFLIFKVFSSFHFLYNKFWLYSFSSTPLNTLNILPHLFLSLLLSKKKKNPNKLKKTDKKYQTKSIQKTQRTHSICLCWPASTGRGVCTTVGLIYPAPLCLREMIFPFLLHVNYKFPVC